MFGGRKRGSSWLVALVASGGGCHLVLGLDDFTDQATSAGGGSPVTCGNGARDGDETALDCGGSCGPCADGQGCGVGTDCQSQVCIGGTCRPPACDDKVKNGDELGVDCRGSCVAKCRPGEACQEDGDCKGGKCEGGTCAPTCTDGERSGSETDADCGGLACVRCDIGRACDANSDCTSGICKSDTCLDYHIWSQSFGDITMQLGDFTPSSKLNIDPQGDLLVSLTTIGPTSINDRTFGAADQVTLAIIKLAPDGTYKRHLSASADGPQLISSIHNNSSSQVIVSGAFYERLRFSSPFLTTRGQGDAFVSSLNEQLIPTWVNQFGSSSDDTIIDTAPDDEGNIIVIASGEPYVDFGGSSPTGAGLLTLAKLDAGGRQLWSMRIIDGSTRPSSVNLSLDKDNNIFIAGAYSSSFSIGDQTAPNEGGEDIFVAKLSSNAELLWLTTFGDSMNQRPHRLAIDKDGNAIIAGNFGGTIDWNGSLTTTAPAGMSSVFVAKIDPAGRPMWAKGWDNARLSGRFWSGLGVDAAGRVLISGTFTDNANFGGDQFENDGNSTAFMVKLDSMGNHVWSRAFGDDQNPVVFTDIDTFDPEQVAVTGWFGGSISLGGQTLSAPAGHASFFVAKLRTP